MSLTRFQYFSKVARLGSIRKAAEVLHVVPSALSRQIAKLEEGLGVELLEPNGRGIRLTPAGEILARHASQMIDSLEQARSQIDELIGLRRGHVSVWTVEGRVSDLVLPAVARFQREYPAVTYSVTTAGSDRIVTALLEDDADLGIIFDPPEHPDLTRVGHIMEMLYVITHPKHLLARSHGATIAELAEFPIALPEETFGLRHMIDGAAKAAGLKLVPTLVTNSIEALRSFARVGAGVTILPHLAVAGDIERRTLKGVPLVDNVPQAAQTTILARRERRLPVAAMRFAERLVDVAMTLKPT